MAFGMECMGIHSVFKHVARDWWSPVVRVHLGSQATGLWRWGRGKEGHHALHGCMHCLSDNFLEAGGFDGLRGPPETTEHQTESGLESGLFSSPLCPYSIVGAFVDTAELGQPCFLCFVSCLQRRSQMHPLPYHPWPEYSLPASLSAPLPLPTTHRAEPDFRRALPCLVPFPGLPLP